jgi:hypothetical protein
MEGMRDDDTYQNVYQHAVGLSETLGFDNPSIRSNQLNTKPFRVHSVPASSQDCVVMTHQAREMLSSQMIL